MDFFSNDSISPVDVKDEICFKDEPLEYYPEEAFSSISSEHSALQGLNLKQEDILPVSSYLFIS